MATTTKKSASKATTNKASRSIAKAPTKTVKKAAEEPKKEERIVPSRADPTAPAEPRNDTYTVKAADVMAVNEDGTMEPLPTAIPEIDPEETVTVDLGEEDATSPSPSVTAPLTQGNQERGAETDCHTSVATPVRNDSAATIPVSQPVYQVVQEREPMVKVLYLDSCIENNQIPIGGGRVITGSGRVFSVKLSDFEGTFMTPLVTLLLKKRKFIVLEGLTDDQRQQYGVDYREGEIVKNEGMFDWFLTAPVKDAARVFEQLCPEHRELVARRFMSAHERGDNRLTRDRIEALNTISKRDFEDGRGAFTPIIEALNKAAL